MYVISYESHNQGVGFFLLFIVSKLVDDYNVRYRN